MSNEREISKKLEEELEGYDEAVVLKIRELSKGLKETMDRSFTELAITGECIIYEEDWDITDD